MCNLCSKASNSGFFSYNSCSAAQKMRTRGRAALVPTTTSCSENLNVRISEFPLGPVGPLPRPSVSPCVCCRAPNDSSRSCSSNFHCWSHYRARGSPHPQLCPPPSSVSAVSCACSGKTFHVQATNFHHTEVPCAAQLRLNVKHHFPSPYQTFFHVLFLILTSSDWGGKSSFHNHWLNNR